MDWDNMLYGGLSVMISLLGVNLAVSRTDLLVTGTQDQPCGK